MPDESTYGFNRVDAGELINLIGNRDTEWPEIRPRPRGGGGGRTLMGKVTAQGTGTGDWTGLDYVDVTVIWGPDALIATTVRIYDHSGDILDLPDLTGYSVWASETKARTLDTGKDCTVLTPLFWGAVNRGCSANNQTFRECV